MHNKGERDGKRKKWEKTAKINISFLNFFCKCNTLVHPLGVYHLKTLAQIGADNSVSEMLMRGGAEKMRNKCCYKQ